MIDENVSSCNTLTAQISFVSSCNTLTAQISFYLAAMVHNTGNVHADTGPDGHCPHPRSPRQPAHLCPWWDHFMCGPTMDANRWADGMGLDMGGAHQGPCLRALFPV